MTLTISLTDYKSKLEKMCNDLHALALYTHSMPDVNTQTRVYIDQAADKIQHSLNQIEADEEAGILE
jgi:hypothetical protein